MEHKITTENILKAAEKFPEFKETLKTMYPDAFKEVDKYFNLKHLKTYPYTGEEAEKAGFVSSSFLQVRMGGEYAGKSFYLDERYNWEIAKDCDHKFCLIPTRK